MSYRTVGVLKGVLENFADFAIMHLCRVPKSEPKCLIYPFSLHADGYLQQGNVKKLKESMIKRFNTGKENKIFRKDVPYDNIKIKRLNTGSFW